MSTRDLRVYNMTFDNGIITSFRNITLNPMLAFYSYEGKDINASDQNWKNYSDPVTIPEGVDPDEIGRYERFPYFIQKLMDESDVQVVNLEIVSDI